MEIDRWMAVFQERLLQKFGSRLLFLGLQGSRRRGEARPDSDIDVVAVLDTLSVVDLESYKDALAGMPEGELACGFICGREELLHWPKYDLFTLEKDTRAFYGVLAPLLPPLEDGDARQFIQISAANLYHAACHMYLYENPSPENVRQLYKSVFYILRVKVYLEQGYFVDKKAALSQYSSGCDLEVINAERQLEDLPGEAELRPYFELLCGWCSKLLKQG